MASTTILVAPGDTGNRMNVLVFTNTFVPPTPSNVSGGGGFRQPLITYTTSPLPDRRADDELALALLGAF